MTYSKDLRDEEQEIIALLKAGKQVYADTLLYEFTLDKSGLMITCSANGYTVGAYWEDYSGKNFVTYFTHE